MKRIALYIFIFLGAGYLGLSYYFYQYNSSRFPSRLVFKGEIPTLNAPKYEFKYYGCPGLWPFKIGSDGPIEIVSTQSNNCLVTFKGHTLMVESTDYIKQVYESGKQLGLTLPEQTPMDYYLELNSTINQPSFFYLPTARRHRHQMLFIQNAAFSSRIKAKSYFKSGKSFLIQTDYEDRERPSSRIEFYSPKTKFDCIGSNCLEYMSTIGVLNE